MCLLITEGSVLHCEMHVGLRWNECSKKESECEKVFRVG